ncbi:MAG: hypothetical protein FWF85_02495 [Clostridiales bacterium]|nr:hypothetical protein [Clostridiales bacterium]
MLGMKVESVEWYDQAYVQDYGKEKIRGDLIKYNKLINGDWNDVYLGLLEKNPDYSFQEFHKEVVLKKLTQK